MTSFRSMNKIKVVEVKRVDFPTCSPACSSSCSSTHAPNRSLTCSPGAPTDSPQCFELLTNLLTDLLALLIFRCASWCVRPSIRRNALALLFALLFGSLASLLAHLFADFRANLLAAKALTCAPFCDLRPKCHDITNITRFLLATQPEATSNLEQLFLEHFVLEQQRLNERRQAPRPDGVTRLFSP